MADEIRPGINEMPEEPKAEETTAIGTDPVDDAVEAPETIETNETIESDGVSTDDKDPVEENEADVKEEKKETYSFRWEYSEQSIADKSKEDQRKYKRGKGTLVYAIIMTVAFLAAFAILITSISFGDFGTASNIALNPTLTTADIVDIGMPSTLAIFVDNGDGTASMGSGFALTNTGYVMTNYHIVDNATTIWVLDSNYKEYAVSLVGYDEVLDIAVLYAENADFVPATIGNSDEVRLGGNVVAIGCPKGEELMFSVSNGIISGVGRDRGGQNTMIQTNAPLNPGNSGGPLFDENGRVIGVVTSKLTTTVTGDGKEIALEGIAFAVPINEAMALAEELIAADLARPMLGVGGVSVEEGNVYFFSHATGYLYRCISDNGSYYYVNEYKENIVVTEEMKTNGSGVFIEAKATGVAIVSITRGLGADGVLEVGDIVTEVDGVAVKTTVEVKTVFLGFNPGDAVDITYYRNGSEHSDKMTLKTKAEMLAAEAAQ